MAEYYRGKVETIHRSIDFPGNEVKRSKIREIDLGLDTSRFHICLPLNGTEKYRIDGEVVAVSPGSYIILNPEQEARAEDRSGNPVEGVCCFLTAELLSSVATDMSNLELQEGMSYPWQQRPFLTKVYHLQENPFGRYLQQIVSLWRRSPELITDDGEDTYFAIAQKFLETHQQITDQLKAIPYVRTPTKQEIYRRVSRVHQYILEEYEKPINLDTLEKIGLFSKYHLIRLYQHLYQITPYQHVLQLRLQKAKELLVLDYSPTEIAYRLSFTDRRAFSKAFKRYTGYSPKAFQERFSSIAQ